MEGAVTEGSGTRGRFVVESRSGRFLVYGLAGWCWEVLFTGIHDYIRTHDARLPSRTSLWMFPIYGLLLPMFEPLHDGMRDRVPAPLRAAVYAVGFFGVEYSSGRLLRRLLGRAPWDYSYTRRHLHALIRFDYAPMWALAGLALEPLHDLMTGRR
jgi:uncharacterized membrane protein